jgi:hypothetical protein
MTTTFVAALRHDESPTPGSHLVHSRIARLWLRELPHIVVLALTIFGVAYTGQSQIPKTQNEGDPATKIGIGMETRK